MHARNGSAEGCDVPMTASLHSSKRSYCTHTTSRLAGLTVSPVASTAPPVQPLKIVRYEKRWGMTSHTYFVYIRTLLCGILSLALFTDGGAKVGFRVLLSTIYKRYLSANFVSGIRIYTIYRLCVCVCIIISRNRAIIIAIGGGCSWEPKHPPTRVSTLYRCFLCTRLKSLTPSLLCSIIVIVFVSICNN